MTFNSVDFFWFILIVLPVYYLLPGWRGMARTIFLVLASYCFYAYWNPWFLLLIFGSTMLDFQLGKLFEVWEREKHGRIVAISAVFNLGMLGVFKYADFFGSTLSDAILEPAFGLRLPKMIDELPVGISFYTFQTMSYCIDLYRGQVKVERNFFRFMLYVAYFPQLVAGPIERAKTLLAELREKMPRPRPVEPGEACFQIAYGLFKKMAVADSIGPLVQPVFAEPGAYSGAEILLAACLFSMQIYCDFSGYTDIAIGISKLFGIRLMRNFRYPYFSASITEFWRRWHISLSTWLRDYLYIVLGGNRDGRARTYANLMITMLLGGLWHGPSWNFVLWGFAHGAFLALHRIWRNRRAAAVGGGRVPGAAARAASETGLWKRFLLAPPVFLLVSLTWIPFVCLEFGQTVTALARIFTWAGGADATLEAAGVLQLCLFLVLLVLLFDAFESWHENGVAPRSTGAGRETTGSANTGQDTGEIGARRVYGLFVRPLLPAVMILLTMIFASPENRQFIYFQF